MATTSVVLCFTLLYAVAKGSGPATNNEEFVIEGFKGSGAVTGSEVSLMQEISFPIRQTVRLEEQML